MSEWQPIETYQTGDSRDENGKWVPGPDGPIVELKMKNGRIVCAQWKGVATTKFATAYAFWVAGKNKGIGLCDPTHWRPVSQQSTG